MTTIIVYSNKTLRRFEQFKELLMPAHYLGLAHTHSQMFNDLSVDIAELFRKIDFLFLPFEDYPILQDAIELEEYEVVFNILKNYRVVLHQEKEIKKP